MTAPTLTPTIGPAGRPPRPSVPSRPDACSGEPEPVRRTASVVMGGDLLWHNTVWLSAAEDAARSGARGPYDFDSMFAALRPLVSGRTWPSATQRCRSPARATRCSTSRCSRHRPDRALDRADRLRRLHHGVQPRGRPGLRGSGPHRGPARGQRRPSRRHVSLRPGAPGAGDPDDRGRRADRPRGRHLRAQRLPAPEGRPWSVSLWDARDLIDQASRARRRGRTSSWCTCTAVTSTHTSRTPTRKRWSGG